MLSKSGKQTWVVDVVKSLVNAKRNNHKSISTVGGLVGDLRSNSGTFSESEI